MSNEKNISTHNSNSVVFFSFIVLLVFVLASFFVLLHKKSDTSVHIVFCDVGQGDAILIYQGFFQILIDSSRDDRVLACLSQNIPIWDQTIEVLVITHFDADHFGGVTTLLKHYRFTQIFAPKHTSDGSRGAGQAASQNATELPFGFEPKEPFFGQTVSFASGATLTFLPIVPLIQANKQIFPELVSSNLSDNDTSLVTLFQYGTLHFLSVGDLEKTGESVLTSLIEFGPIDIFKVGHHGAKTSSTIQFLQAINPRMAIISSGRDNSYGHPAQQTLDRLGQMGATVLRTDWIGTIEFVSDGAIWWLAN